MFDGCLSQVLKEPLKAETEFWEADKTVKYLGDVFTGGEEASSGDVNRGWPHVLKSLVDFGQSMRAVHVCVDWKFKKIGFCFQKKLYLSSSKHSKNCCLNVSTRPTFSSLIRHIHVVIVFNLHLRSNHHHPTFKIKPSLHIIFRLTTIFQNHHLPPSHHLPQPHHLPQSHLFHTHHLPHDTIRSTSDAKESRQTGLVRLGGCHLVPEALPDGPGTLVHQVLQPLPTPRRHRGFH